MISWADRRGRVSVPVLGVLIILAAGPARAAAPLAATQPPVEPLKVSLWEEGNPNRPAGEAGPEMEIYRPFAPVSDPTTTFIILPGGGYRGLSPYDRLFAEYFRALGSAAVVVNYRVYPHLYPAAFADALRAIRLVRSRGGEWGLPTRRLILLGESAGGHLASLVATRPDYYHEPGDSLDRISPRVDGLILLSPVISTTASYRYRSLDQWLGPQATDRLRAEISPELHVTRALPPTILFHAADDDSVSVENSIGFARACWAQGVSAELHVYPKAGHGYRLSYNAGPQCRVARIGPVVAGPSSAIKASRPPQP